MSKKMDDARRASRERDALNKDEEPTAWRGRAKTMCPMRDSPLCGSSMGNLWWDPKRELWTHSCGFTATQQELDDGLA